MRKLTYLGLVLVLGAALGSGSRMVAEKPAAKVIEATGCVERGVEAGCLMLVTADGTKYNILAQERPAVGTWIRIRGIRHDGPTICMEGTPVRVQSWKKLADSCPKSVPGGERPAACIP